MPTLPLLLLPLLCLVSPDEPKNNHQGEPTLVSKSYNALFSQSTFVAAKDWRYWPNIGCYEFSFERTVFFEMSNEATRLSAPKGSQLRKLVLELSECGHVS